MIIDASENVATVLQFWCDQQRFLSTVEGQPRQQADHCAAATLRSLIVQGRPQVSPGRVGCVGGRRATGVKVGEAIEGGMEGRCWLRPAPAILRCFVALGRRTDPTQPHLCGGSQLLLHTEQVGNTRPVSLKWGYLLRDMNFLFISIQLIITYWL